MKKTKIKVKSLEEIYQELFACINCVFELNCNKVLPFPINLCNKCEDYIKRKLE